VTVLLLFALAATVAASERDDHASQPAPDGALRVAAWNLGQAGGAESVLAELDRLAARSDVLALQEVTPPDEAQAPIADWAAARGWAYTAKESNAIASRLPIVRSGVIAANPAWSRDLPWVEVESPSGARFRIYSVHLSFKYKGNPFIEVARGVEASRIARDARAFDGPVVLAGDFNSIGRLLWGHADEAGLSLLRKWGYRDATRGLSGDTHYLGRLDWIYTLGLDAEEAELGRSVDSDHRWLWARLCTDSSSPPEAALSPPPSWRQAAVGVVVWLAAGWFRRRRDTVSK